MNGRVRRRGNSQRLVWTVGLPLVIIVVVVIVVVMKLGGDKWFATLSVSDDNIETLIKGTGFSDDNWKFDSGNNVYYQIGLRYATKSVSDTYETMGIYVPGQYLTCVENGDKYKCAVNETEELNGYTSQDAPMVMPIEGTEYEAVKAPASYNYRMIADYVKKGFVYLAVGYRGRMDKQAGAGGVPWGVVDIKAAIRYVRYKGDLIPGDKNAIFVSGAASGGTLAAVLGASGDSLLYDLYLEEIGAAMSYDDGGMISDAVMGVNTWSLAEELVTADMAYEWNMGQYSRDLTDSRWGLSKDLSLEYVNYVNAMGFIGDGVALGLESEMGGGYYDYIVGIVEQSLNNYLMDKYNDEKGRSTYLARLGDWVSYENGWATITDFAGFIKKQRPAKRDIPAFDRLDGSSAENGLFANGDNKAMHFDNYLLSVLSGSDYGVENVADYQSDVASVDAEGTSQWIRVLMYSPTVYLLDYYGDALDNSSIVAPYWRVREGTLRTDVSMVTGANLTLALKNYPGVGLVDYEMIWGEEQVERVESAVEEYVSWVESVTK